MQVTLALICTFIPLSSLLDPHAFWNSPISFLWTAHFYPFWPPTHFCGPSAFIPFDHPHTFVDRPLYVLLNRPLWPRTVHFPPRPSTFTSTLYFQNQVVSCSGSFHSKYDLGRASSRNDLEGSGTVSFWYKVAPFYGGLIRGSKIVFTSNLEPQVLYLETLKIIFILRKVQD